MKRFILPMLILAIAFTGCKKDNNDVSSINQEQSLSSTKWKADVSGVQQEIVFNADTKFKFSVAIDLSAISPNLRLQANLSGNWTVVDDHIVISNPQIELLNNGTVVTNVQSIFSGLSSYYYTLLSDAIKQYNQYIEIDSNGNIKLSSAASSKISWYIERLNNNSLKIKIGDILIEFKKA